MTTRILIQCSLPRIETILVIRDVGVQVKTVYLGGRSVSRFIDRSKISDIIINEAITMFHIRVYMAIIVEGEDKMVVVFQVTLMPHLSLFCSSDSKDCEPLELILILSLLSTVELAAEAECVAAGVSWSKVNYFQ